MAAEPDMNHLRSILEKLARDERGAVQTEYVVLVGTVGLAVMFAIVAANQSSITINVLANDSDPDGTLNPATVTVTSAPTGGTTSVNPATGSVWSSAHGADARWS